MRFGRAFPQAAVAGDQIFQHQAGLAVAEAQLQAAAGEDDGDGDHHQRRVQPSPGQGLFLTILCIPAIAHGRDCSCNPFAFPPSMAVRCAGAAKHMECARAAIHGGQMREVGQCLEQLPRTPEPHDPARRPLPISHGPHTEGPQRIYSKSRTSQ